MDEESQARESSFEVGEEGRLADGTRIRSCSDSVDGRPYVVECPFRGVLHGRWMPASQLSPDMHAITSRHTSWYHWLSGSWVTASQLRCTSKSVLRLDALCQCSSPMCRATIHALCREEQDFCKGGRDQKIQLLASHLRPGERGYGGCRDHGCSLQTTSWRETKSTATTKNNLSRKLRGSLCSVTTMLAIYS